MPVVGFWVRTVGKLTRRASRARFSLFPYKEIAERSRDTLCTMSLHFAIWLSKSNLETQCLGVEWFRFITCHKVFSEVSYRQATQYWQQQTVSAIAGLRSAMDALPVALQLARTRGIIGYSLPNGPHLWAQSSALNRLQNVVALLASSCTTSMWLLGCDLPCSTRHPHPGN